MTSCSMIRKLHMSGLGNQIRTSNYVLYSSMTIIHLVTLFFNNFANASNLLHLTAHIIPFTVIASACQKLLP